MTTYYKRVTAYVPGKHPWTHRIRTFYDKECTKRRTDEFAIILNGKLESHGLVTTWHENGHLIKTDQFYKGIQTGTTSMFRVDGTLFGQITYKNGLKHGWTANYDHTGKQLLNQTQWINNIRRRDYIYYKDAIGPTGKKIIKEIIDYDSNKIKQKSYFDISQTSATHHIFYENGNPHFIINEEKISADKYNGRKNKDNKTKKAWVLSGPLEIYYPDGILKMRMLYNCGREDTMLRKQYDCNGKQLFCHKSQLFNIPNYTSILKPLDIN